MLLGDMIRIYGLRKMRMCSMGSVSGLWMIYSCANYWVGVLFYLEIQVIFGVFIGFLLM